MDRARFDYLLEAYGADLQRWPAEERAAAAQFAAQNESALAEARALDAALESAREPERDVSLLSTRILRGAPRLLALDRRALVALAACAVFGVLIGYSGGLLAPAPGGADAYFAAAFEAPLPEWPGDEG